MDKIGPVDSYGDMEGKYFGCADDTGHHLEMFGQMDAPAGVSAVWDVALEYGVCQRAEDMREGCCAAVERGRVLASAGTVGWGNSGNSPDERHADESDAHMEHGSPMAGMGQVEEANVGDW